MPPHAYLIQRQVREAKRLLERGVPIAQAADASGFTDQSHLHRHFRRTWGITPGQYRNFVQERRGARVEFQLGNMNDLPFEQGVFDGAFLCFVLEHLNVPGDALGEIRRVLKPGATLHAFEGDHGSVLAWPSNPAIDLLVAAVSRYQILQGGDPYLGRRLSPLLRDAGFFNVAVEPRIAYADGTRPAWIDGFTRCTFIDMMKGQREAVIGRGLLGEADWDQGILALERAAASDATFCYTFFRGTATC